MTGLMLDLRDKYFLPTEPGAVELRAFTHGLMPRSVPAMLSHFERDWRVRGADAWNRVPNHWLPDSGLEVGWWTLPEFLGDHFVAKLLNAPPGTCILQSNVHWSIQCVLSCAEVFRARPKVVLSSTEFPSVLHSVTSWADLTGIRPVIIPPNENGFVDREALLSNIDGETAMVFASHVGFTTGERLEDAFLRRLADTAHAAGAFLLVDGYHAAGSLEIDAGSVDADFYVGGLLKEASGSSGSCFLYVKPGIEVQPTLTGWFGDGAPFDFGTVPEVHPEVRRRFLGGTTAVASMYHAVEGLRILFDAGMENVERDVLGKVAHAVSLAAKYGIPVRSPRDEARQSALVVLELPDADRLSAWLKTRHIFTDSRRSTRLRLAPFVWNTLDDLERTFEAISDALESGAYLGYEPAARGPVT